MNTLSNRNFGLIIAYLLPGFVALWGVGCFFPAVESWVVAPQAGSPTVAGFMYVTLASLSAGVTVSAVRWAILDHLHHATGILPPVWRFAKLEDKLQAYLILIENHYRYYQCFGGSFIAAGFSCTARWLTGGYSLRLWPTLGFLALEAVLFFGSRDCLDKYYLRTQQLLNSR